MHADAEGDVETVPVGDRGCESRERLLYRQRRPDGSLRVVLVCLRDSEHRYDGVAHELLADSSVALDLAVHELEELSLQDAHVLRIEALP